MKSAHASPSADSLRCLTAVLPLSLYALLVSCSAPGGPDPAAMSSSDSGITLSSQLLPITATAEMNGETFELEVKRTTD